MQADLTVQTVIQTVDQTPDPQMILATHARSFRWAQVFMPAAEARAGAVVYALCRLADDSVDEAPSPQEGLANLAVLTDELQQKKPPRPLVALFLQTAKEIQLDLRFVFDLLDGMRFDASVDHTKNERLCLQSDADLLLYCYQAAGTVGGMMCAVIGVKDPRALPFAIDLGIAMQLTNICRDVAEDAGRLRVYLPQERLQKYGIESADILDRLADTRVQQAASSVVRDLLALAERYYQSADRGMGAIPWRSRFAILIAGRIYRAIGLRLLRRLDAAQAPATQTQIPTQIPTQHPILTRTFVPWYEKVLWVLRAFFAFWMLPRWYQDSREHTHATREAGLWTPVGG